jgi:phosphatidylserine decarboxylase
MQMVQGLFVFNERVVLKGQWQHGFFAMAAIGATNVGSIAINIPDQVRSYGANIRGSTSKNSHTMGRFSCSFFTALFLCMYCQPITNSKKDRLTGTGRTWPLHRTTTIGDELGAFRLGSCIVLVFQAPADFEFSLNPGQAIQYGQALGTL